MASQIEDFTIRFFKNLKCKIFRTADGLLIENVPKNFEDLSKLKSPYRLTFSAKGKGIFIGKGSQMFLSMQKFLEGLGKTTLLKINFDVDPIKEIRSTLSFKNCEIDSIEKKFKNSFFARFTFITTFKYMNESEQSVDEIYVHNGKVVKGDLSGYEVLEGDLPSAPVEKIKKDYNTARSELKDILRSKIEELGSQLEEKLQGELSRINAHYDNQLNELGGDLNSQLEKIKELEAMLRTASEDSLEKITLRLDRLKKALVKIGDDDSKNKILREKNFTIKDATHKYSLSVEHKLANTTVIYYPLFSFNLQLNGKSSGRILEMTYDPLSKTINELHCETCNKAISKINLCSSGHITCDECFSRCSSCGIYYCKKCLKRSCSVCGQHLCKNCARVCLGCGKHVCKDHMRTDCVSGDERCTSCLRACMRCHEMASEHHFKVARDGSKVCQKCIGEENRKSVMEKIFDR